MMDEGASSISHRQFLTDDITTLNNAYILTKSGMKNSKQLFSVIDCHHSHLDELGGSSTSRWLHMDSWMQVSMGPFTLL